MSGQNPYTYGYRPPAAGPPPPPPSSLNSTAPYTSGPSASQPSPRYQPQHTNQSLSEYNTPSPYGYRPVQGGYDPSSAQQSPHPSLSSYPHPAIPNHHSHPPSSPHDYQQQPQHLGGHNEYTPSTTSFRPPTSSHMPPEPPAPAYGMTPTQSYQPSYRPQQNFSAPPTVLPSPRPPPSAPTSQYSFQGAYDPRAPRSGVDGGEDAAMRAYMARSRPRPPPTAPTPDPRPSQQVSSAAYPGYASPPVYSAGNSHSRPPSNAVDVSRDPRSEGEKAAAAWRERQLSGRPFASGPALSPYPQHIRPSSPQSSVRPPTPSGYRYDHNAPQRPSPSPHAEPSQLNNSFTLPTFRSTGSSTQLVPRVNPPRPASSSTRPPTMTINALPLRPPTSPVWAEGKFTGSSASSQPALTRGIPSPPVRLPLPVQRNGRGPRLSTRASGDRRGSNGRRGSDGRSRSPPPRKKEFPLSSRTPTPDPLQEVFLVGLESDVSPDQLHEMIDKLCSESDLTTADEVLLLRDRATKVLNGSAIVTFPRIADAIRFANANGPRIENVERFFGPIKTEGQGGTEGVSERKRKSVRVNHGGNAGEDDTKKVEAATELHQNVEVPAKAASVQSQPTGNINSASRNDGPTETIEELPMTIIQAGRSTEAETVPGAPLEQVSISSGSDSLTEKAEESDAGAKIADQAGFVETFTESSTLSGEPDNSLGDMAHSDAVEKQHQPVIQIATPVNQGEDVIPPQTTHSDLDATTSEAAAAKTKSLTSAPHDDTLGERLFSTAANVKREASPVSSQAGEVTLVATPVPLLEEGGKKPSQLLSNKKVALNIANWTKKKEELHGTPAASVMDVASTLLPAQEQNVDRDVENLAGSSSSPAAVMSEGTPPPDGDVDFFSDRTALCCYLCGRKFKTMEILLRHPRESKLHKANLVDEGTRRSGGEAMRKARTTGGATAAGMKRKAGPSGFIPIQMGSSSIGAVGGADDASGEGVKYRDRALERRSVFGSDDTTSPSSSTPASKRAKASSRSFEGPAAPAPVPLPRGVDDKIEGDNVGNKMLQMMGWTEGQVLGTTGGGLERPIQAVMYAKGAGLGAGGSTGSVGGAGITGVGSVKGIGEAPASSDTPGWKARLDQARDGRMSRYEDAKGTGEDTNGSAVELEQK